MKNSIKIDLTQPRLLKYRNHYKVYVFILMFISLMITSFWVFKLFQENFKVLVDQQSNELVLSMLYFIVAGGFYYFWLRLRLNHSVQVFPTHLIVNNLNKSEEIKYSEIESVNIVCWSIFYIKLKSGHKHFFNSGLERVDYIWEGIHNVRPELFVSKMYEEFRLKLVQYDHHQKRKEWFFRHKVVDGFNWVLLPATFMFLAYTIQSQLIQIHQPGLYFFRLFMYAIMVLLITAFTYSIVIKKLIFDLKLEKQLENSSEKFRDLEYEGMILQRSKIFQVITACFIFALIIKTDLNLFSLTKVKENMMVFNLTKGSTIVVDNRYNCVSCSYQLVDGDLVIFGKGYIGQILAKEGDLVGQIAPDKVGRSIASENVHEVPKGKLAIKVADGKEIMFIGIGDLIGRIKK